MTIAEQIASLVRFEGSDDVLSLYLNTDLTTTTKDAVKLTFRQFTGTLEGAPPQDVARVARYLDTEYDWQSLGLAFFSSGDQLWEVVGLPASAEDGAYVSNKPHISELLALADRFKPYSVALLDREGVRLFLIADGRIQPKTEVFGEELKRHKQGGWAAARYQRHADHLALRNLKQSVELIDTYCQKAKTDRLVLAGSSDVLNQVRDLLPESLRRAVVGEFAADMQAPLEEILRRSAEIATIADELADLEAVRAVITSAAKGGQGVIGLSDTLYTLHEGRVHQVFVAPDTEAQGYECTNCGYIATERLKCPFCGNEEAMSVPDAVNRALHKALRGGAAVEVVRDSEELRVAGGIAATLRY